MNREHVEAMIIVGALRRKRCKCFWLLTSRNHDRYKISCAKPCKGRDILLARLNAR
jgi:hypothetical protein